MFSKVLKPHPLSLVLKTWSWRCCPFWTTLFWQDLEQEQRLLHSNTGWQNSIDNKSRKIKLDEYSLNNWHLHFSSSTTDLPFFSQSFKQSAVKYLLARYFISTSAVHSIREKSFILSMRPTVYWVPVWNLEAHWLISCGYWVQAWKTLNLPSDFFCLRVQTCPGEMSGKPDKTLSSLSCPSNYSRSSSDSPKCFNYLAWKLDCIIQNFPKNLASCVSGKFPYLDLYNP